MDGDQGPII